MKQRMNPHNSDPAGGTNLPRFPTDGGHYTDTTAEELVASPRAHNLEAEGLVELALVLRAKEQAELRLAAGRDHPAETHQSKERYFRFAAYLFLRINKAYNTSCSQVVTHPSTGPALHCLTSVVR